MTPFLALITPIETPSQPPGGGQPPGIWGPPGPWPTPPIHLPPTPPAGSPPGIWGPPGPWPTPPIALPPGWISGNPPGIWGGANQPFPTPPIVIPPEAGTEDPKFEVKTGWSPTAGWVVVLVPQFAHPVPSGAKTNPTPAGSDD